MSSWQIKSEQEWETEYRTKHGNTEYERRLNIANTKADELDSKSNAAFAETTFMRPQFQSVAMQLSSEQIAIAENWSGKRWLKLVYKLAGVA